MAGFITLEKVKRYTANYLIPIYSYGASMWHEALESALDAIDGVLASMQSSIALLYDVATAGTTLKGGHSAAGGTFPTPATAGDCWVITTAGVISGVTYNPGDRILYVGGAWRRIATVNPGYALFSDGSTIFSAIHSGLAAGWVGNLNVASSDTVTTSGYSTCVWVSPDGTYFFGCAVNTIRRWTASTPLDITTLGSIVDVQLTELAGTINNFAFSPDGYTLLVAESLPGLNRTVVHCYALSTALSVSGRTLVSSTNVAGAYSTSTTQTLFISEDGRKLVLGSADSPYTLMQFELLTPWRPETAVFVCQANVGIGSSCYNVWISSDGRRMCRFGSSTREFYLGVPWRVDSAVDTTTVFTVSTGRNGCVRAEQGMVFFVNSFSELRRAMTGLIVRGSLRIDGYLKQGEFSPYIAVKRVTGTTGATEGSAVSIAHGLTSTKILTVDVVVTVSTPSFKAVGPCSGLAGHIFYVEVTTTNVVVTLHATESESILSKSVSVIIQYER